MFERIKRLYDLGLYSKEIVRLFVNKGIITEEQYTEIVGE